MQNHCLLSCGHTPHLHPCINFILEPTCCSILPTAQTDAGKVSVLPPLHYYGCPVHRNLEVTGSNHDQILPCCGYSPSCGKEASALKPRGNVASCIHYTHSSFVPRRKSQPPPIPPQSPCLMLCPIVFHQSWGARERPRSESTQKHSSISTCPPYALLLLRNQLENHFRPILLGKENFLLNAVFHLIKCHVYYLH